MSGKSLNVKWGPVRSLRSKNITDPVAKRFRLAQLEALKASSKAAKQGVEEFTPVVTGRLKKHLYVKMTRGGLGWSISSDEPYANIVNDGGTIKAATGHWLRIPLPPWRNPRAGERGDFVFKSKRGNLLVAKRVKKNQSGSGLLILAVLKKSVEVKPTRYLDKILERAQDTFLKVFSKKMWGG